MRNIISTVLLLTIALSHSTICGVQISHRQNEVQRAKNLHRILDTGSYVEKNNAILELSWPKSERVNKVLLKRLEQNLAKKQGHTPYGVSDVNGPVSGLLLFPSENELLINALARVSYTRALPTLRKMLKMKREQSGIALYNLAYQIHQITGQPVRYEEDGEVKMYPERQ